MRSTMAKVFVVSQDVGVYESDRKIVAVCSTHDIAHSKACDLLASQFMQSNATAAEFRTDYDPIVIEEWDVDGDRSDGFEITFGRAAQLRPELQQDIDRRDEARREKTRRDEAARDEARRNRDADPWVKKAAAAYLMRLVQYGAQPIRP